LKILSVIGATTLFFALGTVVPAFAQEEHHEAASKPEKQQEAKPAQHEEQAKPEMQEAQAKPAAHQAQPKPAKQTAQAKPAGHTQQAKSVKKEEPARNEKQEPANQQAQEQHGNSGHEQHAQRTTEEVQRQHNVPALRLSARGGGRIPDERYRSNFGREHVFVISQPVIVGGYSRFQYGGYSFGFNEQWPEGWYYTDNVYVEFADGGYYLYNPYYPGARLGITVVL
jgi:hypothetical protein